MVEDMHENKFYGHKEYVDFFGERSSWIVEDMHTIDYIFRNPLLYSREEYSKLERRNINCLSRFDLERTNPAALINSDSLDSRLYNAGLRRSWDRISDSEIKNIVQKTYFLITSETGKFASSKPFVYAATEIVAEMMGINKNHRAKIFDAALLRYNSTALTEIEFAFNNIDELCFDLFDKTILGKKELKILDQTSKMQESLLRVALFAGIDNLANALACTIYATESPSCIVAPVRLSFPRIVRPRYSDCSFIYPWKEGDIVRALLDHGANRTLWFGAGAHLCPADRLLRTVLKKFVSAWQEQQRLAPTRRRIRLNLKTEEVTRISK